MKCPYCLNTKTRVLDKRDIVELDVIRRRRECQKCRKRFTTYERIELVGFSVVKKDGKRERFDRNKVLAGMLRACEKRPIPRERIDRVVDEIEASMRAHPSTEIDSKAIGEMVIRKLRGLDKVAYIRFASVYKEFDDLISFKKELERLVKR